jgi:phospholipid N-methyltransferase
MPSKKTFLLESLKNLKTVGTVTRSSPFLCKEIIKEISWTEDMILLELGAGDGVITQYILKKMSAGSRLYALEVNEEFCKELLKLNDPRLIVIGKDALQLDEIMRQAQVTSIDHVISAIPFVIFPEEQALQIIQSSANLMKSGAKFIQVHYSLLAKKLYEKVFGSVRVKFVPFNVPPAFLLIMNK